MKWLLNTGLDELVDGDFEGKVGRLNVSIGVHSTDLGRPHTYVAKIERDVIGQGAVKLKRIGGAK